LGSGGPLPKETNRTFIERLLENLVKRSLRLLLPFLIVSLWLLSTPGVGYAFPPLPSSFYGTVKLNAANLPDGTRIEALINDQVYAYSQTQTYQGGSVYSLDIPGDDSSTPAVVEGGVEGDTIQFRVGGILASQTAVWHSATNVELNLSVSSTSTPLPPQPTPTPLPTQTSISVPPTQRPPARTAIARTQAAVAPTQTSIANTQVVISSTRTQVIPTQAPLSTAAPALTASIENQAQSGTLQAATIPPAEPAPSTSEPSQGIPSPAASPVGPTATFTNVSPMTEVGGSTSPNSNNVGLFYWITIPTFIGTFTLILLIMAGLVWYLLKKK
jgi:hypothetical protein